MGHKRVRSGKRLTVPKMDTIPEDHQRVYTSKEIREIMDEFLQPTDIPLSLQNFVQARSYQIALMFNRNTEGISRLFAKCMANYDEDGRTPITGRIQCETSIHNPNRELSRMDKHCMKEMWTSHTHRDPNIGEEVIKYAMEVILNLNQNTITKYIDAHKTHTFTRDTIRHDPMKETCFDATPDISYEEKAMKKQNKATPKEAKAIPITEHEGKKYLRRIYSVEDHRSSILVDVYRVCKAFNVSGPIEQAVKKLLCCGQRGKGSAMDDLIGAIAAINRAIEDCELDEYIKEMKGKQP